jgi:hypothetical protein
MRCLTPPFRLCSWSAPITGGASTALVAARPCPPPSTAVACAWRRCHASRGTALCGSGRGRGSPGRCVDQNLIAGRKAANFVIAWQSIKGAFFFADDSCPAWAPAGESIVGSFGCRAATRFRQGKHLGLHVAHLGAAAIAQDDCRPHSRKTQHPFILQRTLTRQPRCPM